ncbi:MAG: deoxyribose-phosphate aldolase [Bacteroidetes bacterium GWE2_40_63]|nr:MAG: deoxyribose-phosphate aldolase [Bacteroidetes bacterium GWC2_40_13]OFX73544.1 MAG: deoxyribose-phosphate aldolase [Bacteroidetes bacterium GWD2_40_43]OFX90779.1 MAG: deoxyribose-phosphate aldolase [Bacteroidetes bacterium GWE2_40_63]OFY20588.1 MAG: deoxyribose-phosphate aldolase [Bacteroidetes bacterium GWF2_40_13]OFZ24695.1 MAG: deoxyribose-phosphate aldolase [Bacteroidetes bacterium RIFOXYC2_FULL_40_12]
MKTLLQEYPIPFSSEEVSKKVREAKQLAAKAFTAENLKLAFSLIDLTTLNSTDTLAKGRKFAENVNTFSIKYPGIPSVAAICVYPPLVKAVAESLHVKGVGIASVAAGFPSSQTYLNVKMMECQQAVADGATDIDIVISLGTWLAGDYQTVYHEVKTIKEVIGKAHLKVILETGALATVEHIWNASIVSIAAGADFIKTSTGKIEPAATPEAVYIMSEAIAAFQKETGKKTAIKPAGGMVTSQDALLYISIVKMVLGNDWMNPQLFRLGASRLANNLVKDIIKLETGNEVEVNHF